jgi:hypothetical protein
LNPKQSGQPYKNIELLLSFAQPTKWKVTNSKNPAEKGTGTCIGTIIFNYKHSENYFEN